MSTCVGGGCFPISAAGAVSLYVKLSFRNLKEPCMDADAKSPTFAEILRSYPFRVVLYAIATLVIFQSVFAAIQAYGAKTVGAENGPVEIAQAVLAVIGAIGLFYAARRAVTGRAGLVLCGSVVAYAAARESDLIFEALLFDDAYKWVVGFPLAVLCAWFVFSERRRLVGETMWLMRQPAATLFVIAGVYLCFVCQAFDRPDMWRGISVPSEAETTKAMVEEFSELFAYLLLAFSGFEATVIARRDSAAASKRETEETYPRMAA